MVCEEEALNTLISIRVGRAASSPEERVPVHVGIGDGDGDGHGGEEGGVGRRGGVCVGAVAEEEGAEAHALRDVAVAVRLALLVEHLVLGRAAATRYLAFWNKAGVSESERDGIQRPSPPTDAKRGLAPTRAQRAPWVPIQ